MSDLKRLKYDFTKVPFKKIVRLGECRFLHSDLFLGEWTLGRFCNYSCSYCWPHSHSKIRDHRPTEVILKTMDEVKRQARRRGFNSFHFSFSGGEPTLHPGYLDILKHYCRDLPNTNYQSLHMSTNLSPALAWFKKFVDITKNLHRVTITATWHPEFAKKGPFIEKVLFLQENDIHVVINIVMLPEKFDRLWKDVLYFHKQGINVVPKLPRDTASLTFISKEYPKDMLELIGKSLSHRDYAFSVLRQCGKKSIRPRRINKQDDSALSRGMDNSGAPINIIQKQLELTDSEGKRWYIDYAERLNALGFYKFKNWECSSGFRSIYIQCPTGSIRRCHGYSHDAPLGSIETGFKLLDYPRKCAKPTCVVSADSKIPKRAPGIKLPLWPGDKTFKKVIKY